MRRALVVALAAAALVAAAAVAAPPAAAPSATAPPTAAPAEAPPPGIPPGTLHGVRLPLVPRAGGEPVGHLDADTVRVRDSAGPALLEGVAGRLEGGATLRAVSGTYDWATDLLVLRGDPVEVVSERWRLSAREVVVDLARGRVVAPGPARGTLVVGDGGVSRGD